MDSYMITASAELMENYLQADILLPQDKFIALQTNAGTSLLFSIGTGSIFNLTMEVPGTTHGWQVVDLSSAQAKSDFADGAVCKTFAASQTVGQTANIHLAMVLSDGTNDHLYLSLNNPGSDLSWAKQPVWISCPFNATDDTGVSVMPPSPLLIANVFISEATDKEYIVVDAIRNPSQTIGLLSRFFMDVSTPSAPVWKVHDLPGDFQAAGYSSCLGRRAKAYGVDGIYTSGMISTVAQLFYVPLYDVFADPVSPTPPPSSRLHLLGQIPADAIAALRNTDCTSDLYVAAQGRLYYFSSSNQTDEATAELLLTNDLLMGIRDLYAYAADGNVIVWGLNGSDEVFYLTCAKANVTTPASWSFPVVIMNNVDAISPYTDRLYSANTFFAHGAQGLIKVVKSPSTTLWNQRSITLPPASTTQDAIVISSYTTRILVTDSNGQSVPNISVTLTSPSVTSVYINHLYYIIGSEPIEVLTDSSGTITIIETAHTLAGAQFHAVVNGQSALPVNPMDSAFSRNAAYNSQTALQNAVITNRDGSTRPFIPAGTSSDDLAQIAQSNQNLSSAYSSVAPSGVGASFQMRTAVLKPVANLSAAGFGNAIATDIGDLYNWLKSGVEAVISIVKDAATGLWHFVASIAGEVYHGILHCVEAVVAAVTWVYNAIKVIIEDIIKFLEFLFGWQDILVTHRVMKNVFLQLIQYNIDGLDSLKSDITNAFASVQSAVDKWANIPDFEQTPNSTTSSNKPLAGQDSAPAHLGIHHFQGNISNSSSSYSPASFAQDILQDFINLINNEEQTIIDAYNAIKTDIIDQFGSLTITQIIQKFFAIIVATLLSTVENALVTAVDVFVQLTEGVESLLSATIQIPVLSYLYKELTSGDELSFLDLICLIGAIPATIIYKMSGSSDAPFSNGDAFTGQLLAATSFTDVQNAFFTQSDTNPQIRFVSKKATAASSAPKPVLDEDRLKLFAVVTGFISIAGAYVLEVASLWQRVTDPGDDEGDDSGPSSGIKALVATAAAFGNVAYVLPNISTLINAATDNWYGQLNNVLTGISILKGFVNIPLVLLSGKSKVSKISPFIETVINIAWNVPVAMNAKDNHGAFTSTYKSLIPESVGNFSFNLGGIMEFPITLIKDDEAKLIATAVQFGLMDLYALCMPIAGGIYKWEKNPDQSH